MKEIKKVLFVEPRSPDHHVYERYPLPRLGSIILATSVKEAGYETGVFVESISGIDLEECLSADVVAISTITPTATRGYELARILKEEGVTTVMGGPHVSFLPEEALKFCDYVIRGEADEIFVRFLKALEGKEDINRVPGICYIRDGKVVKSEVFPRCENLNNIPFPDFSLMRGYRRFSFYPVMRSRGCPFNCSFCSVTAMFGRGYRFMDNERVIREIRRSRAEWLFFYDDNFAAHPSMTKELLGRMIKENLTPSWTAQVRVDAAKDRELLLLMKESNCYACYIGIESVNPYTLRAYRKSQTLDDIKRCIDEFHRFGIRLHGMFVLGSDEDSRETFDETVRFARSSGLETVQFMILTPLPGTALYRTLKEEGRILTEAWHLYDGHHVVFQPKRMNPFELQIRTLRAMGRFYSIWQVLKSLLKLDLWTFVLRLYAKRVIAKWKRRNRYYIDLLRNFGDGVGAKIEMLSRKVSEDIIDGIRKILKKEERRKEIRG